MAQIFDDEVLDRIGNQGAVRGEADVVLVLVLSAAVLGIEN